MAEWMIKRHEREAGPFSSQVVLQNIQKGKILKTDLIRKKEQPNWGTCSQLKGVTFPEQTDHIKRQIDKGFSPKINRTPTTTPNKSLLGQFTSSERVFSQDKYFIEHTEKITFRNQYSIFDEHKNPLIFVDRPWHFWRNFIATTASVIVGICMFVLIFGVGMSLQSYEWIAFILALPCAYLAGFLIYRLLCKERHITFYADEARTHKFFELKQNEKCALIKATYSLTESNGNALAVFEKNYLFDFFRKKWCVTDASGKHLITAREDSTLKSLIRRLLCFVPRPFSILTLPVQFYLRTNFIFFNEDEEKSFGCFDRKFTANPNYVLDMTSDSERLIDRRIAAALGVLLDTAEKRGVSC
ncbi:DUF4339 domain-containing protein [Pirellulales bacterium]|nr:DUF4339 domain-containing protein [Pirellulales bacterium]